MRINVFGIYIDFLDSYSFFPNKRFLRRQVYKNQRKLRCVVPLVCKSLMQRRIMPEKHSPIRNQMPQIVAEKRSKK
ncbi:MAG: hypothetical protein QMD65_01660 [Patescibacteria group bacterium]|nr:hypothetical protein [Patescibacteria group bacterium]